MKKLGILLDSFTGVSKKEIEKMGMEFIYQTLIINGEVIRDGIDYTQEEIIKKLSKVIDYKTSMPAIGLFLEKIEEMKKKYEKIIFLPMNKGFSSTYSTAVAATSEMDNVYVINTKVAGHTNINVGLKCIEMANENKSIDEILKYVNHINENSHCYVIPNDLNRIVQSGRLTGVKKFILQKGKLIPKLYVTNEGFEVKGVKRSFKKALDSSIKKILEDIGNENIDEYKWELLWSGNEGSKKILENTYIENGIKKFESFYASCGTIGYTGTGAVGIMVYKIK